MKYPSQPSRGSGETQRRLCTFFSPLLIAILLCLTTVTGTALAQQSPVLATCPQPPDNPSLDITTQGNWLAWIPT